MIIVFICNLKFTTINTFNYLKNDPNWATSYLSVLKKLLFWFRLLSDIHYFLIFQRVYKSFRPGYNR